MITRIVKEMKVFDIKARATHMSGHGYDYIVPGITWINGQPWESEEECKNLLAEAIKDWERRWKENHWNTTSYKPKLKIYWKIIEINENNT